MADLEKENDNLRKMVSRHSEHIRNLFQRVDQLSEINGVLTQRFLLHEIEAETKGKEKEKEMTDDFSGATAVMADENGRNRHFSAMSRDSSVMRSNSRLDYRGSFRDS